MELRGISPFYVEIGIYKEVIRMHVTKMVNLSLFRIIKEHETIDYSTLRKIYVQPTPPGVVTSSHLIDSDLAILKEEGYIKIEGRCITALK